MQLPVREEASGEIDLALGDCLAGQDGRVRSKGHKADHRHGRDGGGLYPVARDTHGDRGALPDRLQPGQKRRVGVKLFRELRPGQAEIGGAHEHRGIGGVDHRASKGRPRIWTGQLF